MRLSVPHTEDLPVCVRVACVCHTPKTCESLCLRLCLTCVTCVDVSASVSYVCGTHKSHDTCVLRTQDMSVFVTCECFCVCVMGVFVRLCYVSVCSSVLWECLCVCVM